MKNEIILYRPYELAEHIEVRFDEDTVWLTQAQIAELFGVKQPAISKHLKNIFNCGELDEDSVYSILEYTAADGKRYDTRIYNLDAILSVGYRVNSINATVFRRWATSKLKDILLKGHAINNRMNRIEDNVEILKHKIDEIGLQINTQHIPTQGVFFSGQVFGAYEFASKIIRSAKHSIILIDNYIAESTLTHLAKKKKGIKSLLLVNRISNQLTLDIQKANSQYGDFYIKKFTQSHDRFLIIDNGKEVYHLGASLKDLGKKLFAFSKLSKELVADILSAVSGLI